MNVFVNIKKQMLEERDGKYNSWKIYFEISYTKKIIPRKILACIGGSCEDFPTENILIWDVLKHEVHSRIKSHKINNVEDIVIKKIPLFQEFEVIKKVGINNNEPN